MQFPAAISNSSVRRAHAAIVTVIQFNFNWCLFKALCAWCLAGAGADRRDFSRQSSRAHTEQGAAAIHYTSISGVYICLLSLFA